MIKEMILFPDKVEAILESNSEIANSIYGFDGDLVYSVDKSNGRDYIANLHEYYIHNAPLLEEDMIMIDTQSSSRAIINGSSYNTISYRIGIKVQNESDCIVFNFMNISGIWFLDQIIDCKVYETQNKVMPWNTIE